MSGMRKLPIIGAAIGLLVGVLLGGADVAQDGHWIIVDAMLAGVGALIGASGGPFIASFRKLQSLADLPEKSNTFHSEESAAEGDEKP